MNQYEHALTATKRLLCAVDESRWANWVQVSIDRWRATHDTSHHLSGYAGMGSFNDIFICRENQHRVTYLQEPWVNGLFEWLRSLCFFLARRPHEFFTAEELSSSIGRLDAPLAAFVGGDKADRSSRGFAGTPVLQGWRCLCCGHADVSHRDLEAFMAADMLPRMVFRACEKLALDQLVDRILAGDTADIRKRREHLSAALRASSISLSGRAGWMRPCPNCGGDNTAVYRWKRTANKEAGFEPTDDNSPLEGGDI